MNSEVVEWLESPAGLRWSREAHKQTGPQKMMFCIKQDAEDFAEERTIQISWAYWGSVAGGQYIPPKPHEVKVYD